MSTPPALRSLQRDFQRHVLAPERPRQRQRIESRVVASAELDASARLAIYANGYRLRLVEALGVEFACLRAVLGEGGFERVCRAFIDRHPSRTPNLRWYGHRLASFLATSPCFARRPLLAEVAAFEWHTGLAFDAADAPRLTIDEMAALPAAGWPHVRFEAHPSLRRLSLHWNAPEMAKAYAQNTPLPKARRGARVREWAVWRAGEQPRFRRLDDDEAWALDALLRGVVFARICAGLGRWHADGAAHRAAALLKGWIGEQMIGKVHR